MKEAEGDKMTKEKERTGDKVVGEGGGGGGENGRGKKKRGNKCGRLLKIWSDLFKALLALILD